MRITLPDTWNQFLAELDEQLPGPVSLGCSGGFVMVFCYGAEWATTDIDSFSIDPLNHIKLLDRLAGEGSTLHRRHGFYMQHREVATIPCDHEERLIQLEVDALQRLTLFALEPHDLALSKLERNIDWDRADIKHLADSGYIDSDTLQRRYTEEHRPYLIGDVTRYDRALDLWLNLCWPGRFPSR